MPKETYSFKRSHGSGLRNSAVYVSGTRLEFDKDKAEIELRIGEAADVYWRLEGKPGSEFALSYKRKGEDSVIVTEGSAIPKKKQRKSNFAFIHPK